MIGYDDIGVLARELGCRTTDLIALAPANDPFYAGVSRRAVAATWFAELWERFGWRQGLHIRRGHYVLVSQEQPVLKPNGAPYENTLLDWGYLCEASLAARYLKLLPSDALVDRRNPDPIIFSVLEDLSNPEVHVYGERPYFGFGLQDAIDPPIYALSGIRTHQDYLVELWIEKTTQNDILVPLAQRLGVNLVPGTGETSEILARQAVERAIAAERPMRILYLSDFDPGGRSMPVGLARKIEFMLRSADLDLDITLQPIVLTPEQCAQYRLPRTPLKETERRAAKFEARFGAGATELDALEAIHPGELRRIVEAEVCRYIDPTLPARVRQAESSIEARIREVYSCVLENYDITDLEERLEEIRDDLHDLDEDARERWQQITEQLELEAPHVNRNEIPRARPARAVAEPLFDARRDYLTQLDHYRAWQGRGGQP